MFTQDDAGYRTTALTCWELKTVAESHTLIVTGSGEVYGWEAVTRKHYINQLRPLVESQYGVNVLLDGALLHRTR